MNVITIDYNNGVTVPEAKSMNFAINMVGEMKSNPYCELVIGSSLIVLCLRVLISEGKLETDNLKFVFQGEEVVFDNYGEIVSAPKEYVEWHYSYDMAIRFAQNVRDRKEAECEEENDNA